MVGRAGSHRPRFGKHPGRRPAFDAASLAQEYRAISEDAAMPMLLLMHA